MPIGLKTVLLLLAMACLVRCAPPKGQKTKPSLTETLRSFAVGDGMLKTLYSINFDPRGGETARSYYQAAHGYRGQALIDRVGMGYSRNQLRRFGAVD